MASIVLEQVAKDFGDNTALYPSDLAVKEGEFIVLVGPSGCGKTTFLRLIAGLEDVTSGSIHIDDQDVTWVESKNRGIGMVFQNYALYPHMTVEQNLMYPLNILGLKKAEKRQRVDDVSKMLEIDGLLKRRPGALSGGQQQRVAIGRALVRQPRIFLFDEPLSNLDARLREQMRQEIADLHKKLQRTTIYVTHDQHEAMTLGDRLVVMREGKIVQEGKPLDLYRDPGCLFVAQFLGNPPINTIKGRLTTENSFQGDFGALTLSQRVISEESDLYLGIRPEDIEIVATAQEKEALTGEVLSVEHLGREAHVQVKIGETRLWIVTQGQAPQTDESIHLHLHAEKLFWFSGKSEQRIKVA